MNNNFSKYFEEEINELHNIFHAISDIMKQRNGYFFFFKPTFDLVRHLSLRLS
jgi:hypothetical protein